MEIPDGTMVCPVCRTHRVCLIKVRVRRQHVKADESWCLSCIWKYDILREESDGSNPQA